MPRKVDQEKIEQLEAKVAELEAHTVAQWEAINLVSKSVLILMGVLPSGSGEEADPNMERWADIASKLPSN